MKAGLSYTLAYIVSLVEMTYYVTKRKDMKDIVKNWGENFLIAVTDDGKEIMGTLTWKKMDPGTLIYDGRPIENTVYELFSLVVPVEYRRSGVARKLCEIALDKAKADKADIYLGKFIITNGKFIKTMNSHGMGSYRLLQAKLHF